VIQTVAYEASLNGNIVTFSDSEGNSASTLGDILTFLVNQYSDDPDKPDQVDHICWNLDDTVALICRFLYKEAAERLYRTKRLMVKCPVGRDMVTFELFYIPDKVFSVERKAKRLQGTKYVYDRASLYGLDQYFAFETFSNIPKSLEETKNLAKHLRKTLKDMGFNPKKLTSPAAIYEECMLANLDLPTYKDIPEQANQYAYMCGGELWIEAHKIGLFKSIVDWDQISAFPSVIATLIDTRNCEWVHSKEYVENAVYGYCKGIVTINDDVQISPILLKRQNCVDLSPTGTWPTYLTKQQLDFILRTKRGSFDMEDGWWAIEKKSGNYELQNIVRSLIALRGKDKLTDFLAKRMATGGLYGKLGEEHDTDFGKHFNPCWFAEISTRVGIEDCRFIDDHKLQGCLIHIGVDGIMLDQEKLPDDFYLTADEQKTWKKAYEGEALISSSGMVLQGTKRPHGLDLAMVKSMIRQEPDLIEYRKPVKNRVTLGEALQGKFSELGMEVDKMATLSLLVDHDRVFSKLPRTGKELLKQYSSRPFKIEEL
jgi:hypothetical protein